MKIIDMEDRSRWSNYHLVGLKEGVKGVDALSFLETNISKWLPSLAESPSSIDRAHRIYSHTGRSNTPLMQIFNLLNYRDRQLILQVAKAAESLQHGQSRISFYPDYSLETTKKRKAFSDVQKNVIPKEFSHSWISQPYLKWPTATKT